MAGTGDSGGPRYHGAIPAPDFDALYAETPPWDIGRPQQPFLVAAERGLIAGRVLDVGCGTGEHTLLAAGLGLDAVGIDASPRAVALAGRKARERGVSARFTVNDVRDLAALDEVFDTVLDCGLYHVLDEEGRFRFVDGLRTVLRPGGCYLLLCFSDRVPGTAGPRRVARDEILGTFREGFVIRSLEEAAIEATITPQGVPAWFATIERS